MWGITAGQKVHKGKQELLLMKDVKELLDNNNISHTMEALFNIY